MAARPSLLALALLALARAGRPGSGAFEPWLLEHWKRGAPSQGGLDIRIAKGLGAKGYGKVRVSLVSEGPVETPDFNFSYRQWFRYRWKEHFLQSTLLDLQPGANELTIGGQKVMVDLPSEDAGVRGVVWSDPCFSSKWIKCAYSERFQTFNHSHQMLNAVFKDPSMNFFMILGDNFYDQTGELTKTLWSQFSSDVKRRFLLVVNGNHDNWVCGSPSCGDHFDNFGIGQMQYYAMDTVSSVLPQHDDTNFLSFAVDPDQRRQWDTFQNVASNFLVYHKLGNLGFLGFTGAATFEENAPYFEQACNYFAETKPAVVFVLGHWNAQGLGSRNDTTAPAVRETLLNFPGCAPFGNRLKYMDGHEHCNYVQAAMPGSPIGFMIGAHGMDDDECEAQYGFLYVDSTGGRVALHYFEVASESKGSRFDEITECLRSRGGLHACTSLAATWLDEPVPMPEAAVVI